MACNYSILKAASRENLLITCSISSPAKVVSPSRYQHGVNRNKLFDYSYGAGELIVCNRGIDEFVRWDSQIQILKVDLPDQAFRAIAEEAGAESVEIRSSTKFEDKRVDALISAIQAEEEGGGLSGRVRNARAEMRHCASACDGATALTSMRISARE
jgi:hypothetical protein